MKVTAFFLILMAAFVALPEPASAEEFLIDASFAYEPCPGEQELPAVAFDGTNHLVVWRNFDGSQYDILGVRVSSGGEVMDSAFIAIAADSGHQQAPAVAYDGTNWLVVWQDAPAGNQIRGARVGPDGTILDPDGFPILVGGGRQQPAVAFDGANYMVVWAEMRGGNRDVLGARVTPGGAVLDSAGFVISGAANHQQAPSVAFGASGYLVAWEDFRSGSGFDLYAARVTTAAQVLDTAGIVMSAAANTQSGSAVAFDGTNYLVAWDDIRNGYNPDVFATRVSQDGTVLDPDGIAVSRTPYGDQWGVAVAFDGTNFLAVWSDYYLREIYGARVSSAGAVLDTLGFAVSHGYDNSDLYPAIGFDGADYFVAWQYKYNTHYDIHAARVTPGTTVLDPTGIVITRGAPVAYYEFNPAVASNGTDYLVVWDDSRRNEADIFGARVSQGGSVLDPTGIAISFAEENQDYPSVAFGSSNYLVVWEDERDGGSEDIYAARVSPNGMLLDPAGIAISMADGVQEDAQAAFDGTNFLVVWQDYRNTHSDIYGARVSPGGLVLDTAGIPVAGLQSAEEDASVTFGGTNYLVVWEDYRDADADIYAARVSPAGSVLDPTGFAVATAGEDQCFPVVAFDGTNYLVVWHDARGASDNDIYCARVTTAGSVLDPDGIAVCTSAENQEYASVAFDGTDYLIAWEDYRNDPDTCDVYGARVSTAGAVLARFPVSVHANWQCDPALARGAGSQVLTVFTGWVDEHQGSNYDAERTWGTFDMAGVAEHPTSAVTGSLPVATVVRGILRLPGAPTSVPRSFACLLDASGRKVFDLEPGPNDVSRLAPGVYFVRTNQEKRLQRIVIVK